MKVTNVLKNVGVGVLVTMLVGCASVGGMAKNQLKVQSNMVSDDTGIVYGTMTGGNEKETKAMCEAINNADPKCSNSDFKIISLTSAFGFASGGYGAFTWVRKDLDYHQCSRLGDSDCSYGKAKLVEGRYAEFIEVVSANKDGKCKWSGLPRAGGVVCDAYNWDYRKNLNDWDTTNGITTIKKK